MHEDGELAFVIVGEAEAYTCSLDYVPFWIESGYRVFGFADTAEEVEWLYRQAQQMKE